MAEPPPGASIMAGMIDGNPRILVLRLSAIGDVVRALPVLHVLRGAYPDARIDWIVERKAAAVVEGNPCLDRLHVFERPPAALRAAGQFARLMRQLRQERYDWAIDVHGLAKSALLTRATGARRRVGFTRPTAKEGAWLAVNERVRLPGRRMSRVDENMLLVQAVLPDSETAPALGEAPRPWIHVPTDVRAEVAASVEHLPRPLVIVHAPVERPEKLWPLEHYAGLCRLLRAEFAGTLLLTWGPGQEQVVKEIAARSEGAAEAAPRLPSLKHFAALVEDAAVYVGGDTGPMHIASAMGTPCAAVFGATDPAKHAPYWGPNIVLGGNAPAHQVEPGQVARSVLELLASRASAH